MQSKDERVKLAQKEVLVDSDNHHNKLLLRTISNLQTKTRKIRQIVFNINRTYAEFTIYY